MMKKLLLAAIAVIMAATNLWAEEIDYRSSRVRFYVHLDDVTTPQADIDFSQVKRKGTQVFALILRFDGLYVWKAWNWGELLYGYVNGSAQKLNRAQMIRNLNRQLEHFCTETRLRTDPSYGYWELQLLDNLPNHNILAHPDDFYWCEELNITQESLGFKFYTVSGPIFFPLWTTADGQYAFFSWDSEAFILDYNNTYFLIEFPIDEAFPLQ